MKPTPIAPVSLWEAVVYWFWLGWISFGGPAGQISLMHQELVERRRWISERRFLHALNYAMVLPGPEAQQLATYLGWLMHGIWGGILAGLLFILPSLLILILLSWGYMLFNQQPLITGLLYGIKPAVTAIVLFSAYRMVSKALYHPVGWLIALSALLAAAVFAVPFPLIVVGAGVVGSVIGRYWPTCLHRPRPMPHPDQSAPTVRAWMDDDTPLPPHARVHRGHILTIALIGFLIWLLVLMVTALAADGNRLYTNLALFFTQAALVTFGGAYAVLPYVHHAAVSTYGWLSTAQMMDGLALGETTPGPLIMIVAFVGFVGAWQQTAGDSSLLAGVGGACVTAFFTFLPSFLFILVGAPWVEATRHELHFTAPLAGITAAVVGVIGQLAFFFAYHVMWPQGINGAVDWTAVLILLIAAVGLFGYQLNLGMVIVGCAGIGGMIHSLCVLAT